MIAVADYAEYGGTTRTVFVDGKPKEVPSDKTPDGERPLWLPNVLERAFICERVDWAIMPEQLDDVAVRGMKRGIEALAIYRAFKTKARDLKHLTEADIEIVNRVEKLRDIMAGRTE